ncbi:hypothetical protein Mal64_36400 [Pseudobythopirellula maris]|uniref:Uncharacterized protein n=1 Tax=Pseudobythopirellula maris TaxID=2527991 RepID=A0A5C5ZI49_9BACT|nr:hypothetical protein Mal64_36400 [Pseudobythopirellula maris]
MHRIACFGFLATPPIASPLVHTNSNTALTAPRVVAYQTIRFASNTGPSTHVRL